MSVLVSFDIDGTLEAGDPPGPITMEMVRKARAQGCIIGSSSDRPLPVQQAIWDKHGIEVSFISAKQNLPEVKSRFPADVYYHIGDTELDRQFALAAGFQFVWMYDGNTEPWINGETIQD
ncbi:MAG: HAD family hydrolase [Chloroflexota bacterium]|nr:HAD family hydrolase [Chloroflexota bacterium]